ncbi:hypothetical protein K0B03_02605 [Patescibacteria group bacterium]|nr:hypothetical protein [Patescibacteria group bacterium]
MKQKKIAVVIFVLLAIAVAAGLSIDYYYGKGAEGAFALGGLSAVAIWILSQKVK